MAYDLDVLEEIKRVESELEEMKKMKIKKKYNITCVNCKKGNLYHDKQIGCMICIDCGVHNSQILDQRPEWRYYCSSDIKSSDPARCGGPINPLLPKLSMGTMIKGNGGWMVKKVHCWNLPYKERSLLKVFNVIQSACKNHNISNCIIEKAKELYKSVSESRISRGKVRDGLIAACVFYACKIYNVARSTKELAKVFNIKVTDITRGCKRFMEVQKKNNKINCLLTMNISKTDNFIARFCSELNINDIVDIIKTVCKKAEKMELVNRNAPPSIVAGSIFLVSEVLHLNISKKDISEKCKISQVTISKCYNKMEEHKKELLGKHYPKKK